MPKIHKDIPDEYANLPAQEQRAMLKKYIAKKSMYIIPAEDSSVSQTTPKEQE